jgi:acetyl esterase/lipase
VVPFYVAGGENALKGFLDFTEPNAEAVRRSREASPITYVKKGMPPFLLIHGTSDPVVPFHQANVMRDKLAQAGSSCEVLRVEGGAYCIPRNPTRLGKRRDPKTRTLSTPDMCAAERNGCR